jgi:hypothetical protein
VIRLSLKKPVWYIRPILVVGRAARHICWLYRFLGLVM